MQWQLISSAPKIPAPSHSSDSTTLVVQVSQWFRSASPDICRHAPPLYFWAQTVYVCLMQIRNEYQRTVIRIQPYCSHFENWTLFSITSLCVLLNVCLYAGICQSYVSRYMKGDIYDMSERSRHAILKWYLIYRKNPAAIGMFPLTHTYTLSCASKHQVLGDGAESMVCPLSSVTLVHLA